KWRLQDSVQSWSVVYTLVNGKKRSRALFDAGLASAATPAERPKGRANPASAESQAILGLIRENVPLTPRTGAERQASDDRHDGLRGGLQIFAGVLIVLSQIRELPHIPFVDQIFNNGAERNRVVVVERNFGPRVQFSRFDRLRELKFRHRDLR